MSRYDAEVIVVGGGPAGAATAAHLAGAGRDVVVLEKESFPREKACGEYYAPGVLDALRRLGALERVLSEEHAWLGGIRLLTARDSFLVEYPGGDGGRRALGIRRLLLDKALLEHARECGARVEERVRVRGAVIEGGRVKGVRLAGGGAEGRMPTDLRARFVVGADGRHSAVVRSLGLEQTVRWPRRLGLHAHYRGAGGGASRSLAEVAEMHVGKGSYCGLAAVGGGLVVAGLVGPMDAKKLKGVPAERLFERRLAEIPGASEALAGAERIGRVRGVGPLCRRVWRVAGPGYLLVGDAAGFFDPFTGEGVHRALRGAELASEAVECALSSGLEAPVDYARGRRAAFGEKERLVGGIQGFVGSPGRFGYALRRLSARPREARVLCGALGDYRAAGPVLSPGYLWSLLRP